MEVRFGKYRIVSDPRQFMVQEYMGVTLDKNGDERERWTTYGYYATLEQVVRALPGHVLRRSGGNLTQAVVEVREVTRALETALRRAGDCPTMLPETYTPEEVAAALRCKPATIRAYARTGLLRGVKMGNLWRFSRRAVEDFLEGEECRSGDDTTASGMPTSKPRTGAGYASLVALGTKRRRKNGMAGS